MRMTPVVRRLAVTFAAAALVLAAGAAAAPSPPIRPAPGAHDTTALGYIEHVVIGRAACDTCPPRVCPGEPILVTISGATESPCVQFRGFKELAVGAPITVLEAEFVADTCGRGCPAVMVPFSASLSLPPVFANAGSFLLQHSVRSCPDTTVVDSVLSRQYSYTIEPNCIEPPPVDTLVRSFVIFGVEPRDRCPGDSLTLEARERGCPPCVEFTSFAFDSASGYTLDMTWRPQCMEVRCDSDSLSVALGAFQAGFYLVNVNVNVHVLDTPNPDSVITFVEPVRFKVTSCDNPPCVDGWLPPRGTYDSTCTAVKPGSTGSATFPAQTGVGVWGAQGALFDAPFLRIQQVEYAGPTPGTFVTWTRQGQRISWIAFTTADAPMLPVGQTPFLRVVYQVDPAAPPGFTALQGVIEQAVGENEEFLPICVVTTREKPPAIPICIEARSDTCDANGDGKADLRDLVSMVKCFRLTDDLPIGATCPDCNADSAFTIADILCCARHILRAPNLPPDSSQQSADVRVAFGTFVKAGDAWMVPVRVTGARSLAGTLLRLRYPSERWRAEYPVVAVNGTSNEGWMPIADMDQPGVANISWLKIGEGDSQELAFTILVRQVAEPFPGDELVMEGVDLVRPDGSALRPMGSLPSASLLDGSGPPPEGTPGSVALGPAQPNPFTSTTSFAVSLPRESTIELTIHDVAGRVVATLARGRFAAGVRSFAWDGAGARGGVYFARLSVDGKVFSQRVAMIRGSR